MPSTALLLPGWAHNAEGLHSLLPEFCDSEAIDYHAFSDFMNFTTALPSTSADILLGWSLGGQIAVRLIAEKHVSCRLLVLIATPYTFVRESNKTDFDTFQAGFKENGIATLTRFRQLVVKDDSKRKNILPKLHNTFYPEYRNNWLSELGNFSCETLDMSHFPPTLLIHGKKDAIVPPEEAHIFQEQLPHSSLFILENCGHAPHLHDAIRCKEAITRAYEQATHS